MTFTIDPFLAEPLPEQLSPDDVASLFAPVGFADWPAAQRILQHLAQAPAFAACGPHLFIALGNAASPDRALVNFERFVRNTAAQSNLFQQLADNPRALEILMT